MAGGMADSITKRLQDFHYRHAMPGAHHGLYDDPTAHDVSGPGAPPAFSMAAKLGLKMPNLAPEVEAEPRPAALPRMVPQHPTPASVTPGFHPTMTEIESPANNPLEPKKKKYAKEAWPGKKPLPSLLV